MCSYNFGMLSFYKMCCIQWNAAKKGQQFNGMLSGNKLHFQAHFDIHFSCFGFQGNETNGEN